MPMYLQMIDSITSSAPAPIDNNRKSLKVTQQGMTLDIQYRVKVPPQYKFCMFIGKLGLAPLSHELFWCH